MSDTRVSRSEQRESLWTKNFVLVCLVAFFCNTSVQMMNTTMAAYANDMWGSKALGGYMTSLFNVGSIAMAFLCGYLVNKLGRRNCLILCGVLFAVPTFLLVGTNLPWLALTVRFLQGMAKGVLYVAAAAMVSDVTPQSRMGEGMSLYYVGSTVAFALGPYIGLLTADIGYSVMFVICALLSLIAGIVSIFIDYEKKDPERYRLAAIASANDPKYRGVWKLIEKKALGCSINFAISFASTSCVVIFLTVFSKEILGYNSMQVCMFYTAAGVAMLILRFTAGRLSDQYGPFTMILPGHAAIFILLLLFASPWVKEHYWLYLVCGVMWGVSTAAISPIMNAMAVLYSPLRRNGEANATYGFVQDFGILFTSLTFGNIIDGAPTAAQGYQRMFYVCLAIATVSLVMALVLFNNRYRDKAIAARED